MVINKKYVEVFPEDHPFREQAILIAVSRYLGFDILDMEGIELDPVIYSKVILEMSKNDLMQFESIIPPLVNRNIEISNDFITKIRNLFSHSNLGVADRMGNKKDTLELLESYLEENPKVTLDQVYAACEFMIKVRERDYIPKLSNFIIDRDGLDQYIDQVSVVRVVANNEDDF